MEEENKRLEVNS